MHRQQHAHDQPHQPRPDLTPSTRALLDAVLSISSDLDLSTVLRRIVTSATELTHARYGAMAVLGDDDELAEFVTTDVDEFTRARVAALALGRGVGAGQTTETASADGVPPATSSLSVPVRVRGTVFGDLYLLDKAWEEPFTAEDEVLVSALADVAGFVIENARAFGLSEQRRRWLEASARLTDATHDTSETDDVAVEVARTARAASGALAAVVLGLTEDDPIISTSPDHRELVEAVLDDLDDDLLLTDGYTQRALGDLRARVVPLRTRLVARCVLVILDGAPATAPDVEERELLLTFAEQAGLTLDRARALAEREELAVVSDRERIARDLHDVVIQRLFATGLTLQGISITAGSPDLSARLSTMVDELDQTIKDIRGTIFELQRQRSDSLRTAVRELAREYAPVLGFTPTITTRGPVDSVVPGEVAQHLLTVAREALSNVARHAGASTCEIHVVADADEVVLRVTDDGRGPGDAAGRGVESGLRNARRRAENLGGEVRLLPAEPRGTILTWTAPL